jgi:hypothetical protein
MAGKLELSMMIRMAAEDKPLWLLAAVVPASRPVSISKSPQHSSRAAAPGSIG